MRTGVEDDVRWNNEDEMREDEEISICLKLNVLMYVDGHEY